MVHLRSIVHFVEKNWKITGRKGWFCRRLLTDLCIVFPNKLFQKAQIAQSIEQAVRKAFEEYIEVRQKREQGSMADNIDDDPFSMLNEIDHTIASDINEILSTVNKMIGHVNSMPQPKE